MPGYITHILPNQAPNTTRQRFDLTWARLQADHPGQTRHLTIDPLSAGWHTPLKPLHFRSGCAPLSALAHALGALEAGQAAHVLITGTDNLLAPSPQEKLLRNQRMAIYGPDCSIPQAYTLLAQAFIQRHGLSTDRFKHLAKLLYLNYAHTARGLDLDLEPKPGLDRPITPLFRAADCANPNIDFHAGVILSARKQKHALNVPVLGAWTAQHPGDGPSHAQSLARYQAMSDVCLEAQAALGQSLHTAFWKHRWHLEAYTCFPVVPLGLLLASGICPTPDHLPYTLGTREVTVTAGMNFARAPWNNPSLHGLICLCQRLTGPHPAPGAILHANGGLGYQQGLALLLRP